MNCLNRGYAVRSIDANGHSDQLRYANMTRRTLSATPNRDGKHRPPKPYTNQPAETAFHDPFIAGFGLTLAAPAEGYQSKSQWSRSFIDMRCFHLAPWLLAPVEQACAAREGQEFWG